MLSGVNQRIKKYIILFKRSKLTRQIMCPLKSFDFYLKHSFISSMIWQIQVSRFKWITLYMYRILIYESVRIFIEIFYYTHHIEHVDILLTL